MAGIFKSLRRSHHRDASVDFTPMGSSAGPLLQAAQASPAEGVHSKLGQVLAEEPPPAAPAQPLTADHEGSVWTYAKHRPTATWFQMPVGFGGPPNLDTPGVGQPEGGLIESCLQPSIACGPGLPAVAAPVVGHASLLKQSPAPPLQQAGAEGVKWHANPTASPRLLLTHNHSYGTVQPRQIGHQVQLAHPHRPVDASPGKLPPPPRHLKIMANASSTASAAPPGSTADEMPAAAPALAAKAQSRAFKFISNLSDGQLQQREQHGEQRQGSEQQQKEQAVQTAMQIPELAQPAHAGPTAPAPPPSTTKSAAPPPPCSEASHAAAQPATHHLAAATPPAPPPPPPRHAAATPAAASAVGAAPGCSSLSAIRPDELLAAAAKLRKAAPAQEAPIPGQPSAAGTNTSIGAPLASVGGCREELLSAIRNKAFRLKKVDTSQRFSGQATPAAATIGRSRPAMAELMRKVQERRAVVEGDGSASEEEWD